MEPIHGKELIRVQVHGQPKNLLVLRGHNSTGLFEAHPLVEEFNKEHKTNLTVVSHKVADTVLTAAKIWLNGFPVDAAIAYEKPGTGLGKEIVFSAEGEPRMVLATYGYKGQKDVALVVLGLRPADFKKDGKSTVLDIPENRLIMVPEFPGAEGWYQMHAETGIPHGGREEVISANTRYLERDSFYVGLPVRGIGSRSIDAYYLASKRLGVLAEVPDADVGKIQALLNKQ